MNRITIVEAIDKFNKEYPSADAFMAKNPGIVYYGEFKEGPCNQYVFPRTVFENAMGIVVSRELVQGLEKNPTVGLITPGIYEFDTGEYMETMVILEGGLSVKGDLFSNEYVHRDKSEPSKQIVAPPHSKLQLATLEEVFYFCKYEK